MTQAFVRSLPAELVTHVKIGCAALGETWLAEWPVNIKSPEDGALVKADIWDV